MDTISYSSTIYVCLTSNIKFNISRASQLPCLHVYSYLMSFNMLLSYLGSCSNRCCPSYPQVMMMIWSAKSPKSPLSHNLCLWPPLRSLLPLLPPPALQPLPLVLLALVEHLKSLISTSRPKTCVRDEPR